MQVIKDNTYYLAIKDNVLYVLETSLKKEILYKFVDSAGKKVANTELGFNWGIRTTDENGIIKLSIEDNGASSVKYSFVQGDGTEEGSIPNETNEFGVITKTFIVTKPLCTITASIRTSGDKIRLVLSNGETVTLSDGQTYSVVPYTTYTCSIVSSYSDPGSVSSSAGTMLNDFTISTTSSYDDSGA